VARKYRLSRRADSHLAKIWREIAADNVGAADALYFRILQKAAGAAEHPGIGSPRPDIGKDTRMLVEGNYNIYYVSTRDGILLTAIVHSKRLPANWL
jgi:plasmid stabilization system protein ParE